jgi:hypothetical protein
MSSYLSTPEDPEPDFAFDMDESEVSMYILGWVVVIAAAVIVFSGIGIGGRTGWLMVMYARMGFIPIVFLAYPTFKIIKVSWGYHAWLHRRQGFDTTTIWGMFDGKKEYANLQAARKEFFGEDWDKNREAELALSRKK